ncbi:MAG: MmcQ/YjbR family DNA-binding protein [Pseudomonadota bacterium]
MKWEEFVALAKELPEVEESTSWGSPSLKVRGKYIGGFNTGEKAFVFRVASIEDQAFLLEAAPHVYYITDHYKGYPAILARPSRLTKKEARGRLEQAWRIQAPKTLVKKYDTTRD